jgi:hypothetical protein
MGKEVGVRHLVRRRQVDRYELRPTSLPGESIAEDNLIAGSVRRVAGIGDRPLPFEPFPGDVGQ